MNTKTNLRGLMVLGVLVFIYFVMYPEDLQAIIAPIASVMELSQTVSPWLYMVIAVGIATWGIVRAFGRRETGRPIT